LQIAATLAGGPAGVLLLPQWHSNQADIS